MLYLPTDRLLKEVTKEVCIRLHVKPDNDNHQTLSQMQNNQHIIQKIEMLPTHMKDLAV